MQNCLNVYDDGASKPVSHRQQSCTLILCWALLWHSEVITEVRASRAAEWHTVFVFIQVSQRLRKRRSLQQLVIKQISGDDIFQCRVIPHLHLEERYTVIDDSTFITSNRQQSSSQMIKYHIRSYNVIIYQKSLVCHELHSSSGLSHPYWLALSTFPWGCPHHHHKCPSSSLKSRSGETDHLKAESLYRCISPIMHCSSARKSVKWPTPLWTLNEIKMASKQTKQEKCKQTTKTDEIVYNSLV